MTRPHHFFSYFPQFHPDPINDRAWGEGFTDWDLIANLPDADRNHFMPKRGQYDPSAPDYLLSLCSQLADAPLPNVGLMVYHYYFDGVHALSGFEQQLLAQPQNAPPFFLCWANETWSKRWIGLSEILIEQRHRLQSALVQEHASYLSQFFDLPTYHRIGNRPLFMLYDAQASTTLPQQMVMYREAFAALGHQPLIGACVSYPVSADQLSPYDFACEFEPRFFFNSRVSSALSTWAARLKMHFPVLFEWIGTKRDHLRRRAGKRIFFYRDYLAVLADGSLERLLRKSTGALPLMRSAFLCWDNLPRYGDRSTSVKHEGIHAEMLSVLQSVSSDQDLPILINSWNEWSEGAALEPGMVYLPLREKFLAAVGSPTRAN